MCVSHSCVKTKIRWANKSIRLYLFISATDSTWQLLRSVSYGICIHIARAYILRNKVLRFIESDKICGWPITMLMFENIFESFKDVLSSANCMQKGHCVASQRIHKCRHKLPVPAQIVQLVEMIHSTRLSIILSPSLSFLPSGKLQNKMILGKIRNQNRAKYVIVFLYFLSLV